MPALGGRYPYEVHDRPLRWLLFTAAESPRQGFFARQIGPDAPNSAGCRRSASTDRSGTAPLPSPHGSVDSAVARTVLEPFEPDTVVAVGPSDEIPLLAGKSLVGGEPAVYLEGNVKMPLSSGLSVLAHVGYSTGEGIGLYYGNDDSYVDWSAGIGYDVGNFSTFVKYVDGTDVDDTDVTPGTKELSRVVFGISTTLPWRD